MQYNGPALHAVVLNNDMAEFNNIIATTSNFNLVDGRGNSVIHLAVAEGRGEMLKKLINAGADLNLRNNDNVAAIEIAFNMHEFELVKMLLDGGADINTKFRDGTSLLHNIIKMRNHSGLLDYVINAGASIDVQDRRGNTPLHAAIQLSHSKKEYKDIYTEIALQILARVENSQTLFQTNLLRKSPRDIAVKSNNRILIAALEKKTTELANK